ncbi:MAG: hypothetical protein VB027_00735 [Gordonibacter sp.]|nr:hypothetical protein [Gordonibacter sp.]
MRTLRQWDDFDVISLMSMVAFFSTMPLLLAPLNVVRLLLFETGRGAVLEPLVSSPLLLAMALAAMFTSLSMLFVCLLKTAYARIGRRLLLTAGIAYLLGLGVIGSAVFLADIPSSVLTLAGIPLGFGAAVLCMSWVRQVRFSNFRVTFAALVVLGAGVLMVDAALSFLDVPFATIVLFVLAVFGTVGCLKNAFSHRAPERATTSGSNWWDVFGRLDLSLVEGGSTFSTPLSRVLFFIVTPAVIFLLFVTSMNMYHTLYTEASLELIGGATALICALPLLFVRSERALVKYLSYQMRPRRWL